MKNILCVLGFHKPDKYRYLKAEKYHKTVQCNAGIMLYVNDAANVFSSLERRKRNV